MPELIIRLDGLSRKQLLIGASGIVAALVLAAAAIVFIREHTALAGLPRDSYRNLSFPVYFPKRPSQGFSFDHNSVSTKPQVLAYSYIYEGAKRVYVSIQPLDPALDISSFRATREISPGIGHGYLVNYDTRTTVAIVTNKSLVLINSPSGVPDPAIEQLADSLQLVN